MYKKKKELAAIACDIRNKAWKQWILETLQDTVTDQQLREKTRTLTESALAMFVERWRMEGQFGWRDRVTS